MRHLFKSILLVLFGLMLASCATILDGTDETVTFNSTPQGADVELDNGLSCESTPCSITVPKKVNTEVTFTKRGCAPKKAVLTSELDSKGILFIVVDIFFGLIPLGVDAATGALYEPKPDPVKVKLDCA